jgi:uncharacterized damage-inducible protein DinB
MPEQKKKETNTERLPEPWLRGTHSEVPPIERAVLHSLEMAREDVNKWCGDLSDQELNTRLPTLPAVAFQLRHIARSIGRFMSYLDGEPLTAAQLRALAEEQDPSATKQQILGEFAQAVDSAERGIASRVGRPLDAQLKIGRKGLPTTHGGLLVHMAEHTQRHVGQAITTAKLVVAQRSQESASSPR